MILLLEKFVANYFFSSHKIILLSIVLCHFFITPSQDPDLLKSTVVKRSEPMVNRSATPIPQQLFFHPSLLQLFSERTYQQHISAPKQAKTDKKVNEQTDEERIAQLGLRIESLQKRTQANTITLINLIKSRNQIIEQCKKNGTLPLRESTLSSCQGIVLVLTACIAIVIALITTAT